MKNIKLKLASVIGGCFLAFGISNAQASVLTFDDIAVGSIGNGYGGFNWNNIAVGNGASSFHLGSGYVYGAVSGTNTAFNGAGGLSTVSSSDFTFDGAFFTAAWRDGLTVTGKGYKDGVELFSKSFLVSTNAPSYLAFNFVGIDNLTLSSSGGTWHDGLNADGTQFVMDNFTYTITPVPEPEEWAMMMLGLPLMGFVARRRKSSDSNSFQAIAA